MTQGAQVTSELGEGDAATGSVGARRSAWAVSVVVAILIVVFFTTDSVVVRDAIYTVIPLLSAIVILATTLRDRLVPVMPWLLLFAGCLFFAVGNAVYLYYEGVLGRSPPFPSAADPFFLAFTIAPALALALLTRGEDTRNPNLLIDSLVAGVGAG